jgi:hypothetical protein
MINRRRARRRPLTEFASRSPIHAFGVWLVRNAVLLAIAGAMFLFIWNVALPNLIDGFSDVIRNQAR